MVKYVAFLRGINVGGKKLIKMEALRKTFESLGFKNVRTYIQSGNVIFEAGKRESTLTLEVEKKLLRALGHEVAVILTTLPDLARVVKQDPFKRIKSNNDMMLFVTFLSAEPSSRPNLPLASATENLDVIALQDRAAFIVARRKKTGWFGFPNNFVEKQLGVLGTTRNWSTVKKIVEFAEKDE